VKQNPLFVPAITKLVAKNMQKGREDDAIKILNRSLKNTDLPQSGRAYMLKTRSHIYYMTGKLDKAQEDIRAAADIITDSGVLATQARIWAAEGRELDTAYEYAIALVRKFPMEIDSWDVLGLVVQAKEGDQAALEIWEKVGRVAEEHSAMFEHIGDANARMGNKKRALDAYNRAIDLSSDGLVMVPVIEKKIRKLK
jgi:tetratricopeptide (TPR) repeat protein